MIEATRERLRGRSTADLKVLAAKNVIHLLARLSPAARTVRVRDGGFDRRWGTETSGLVNLSGLQVDRERTRHGVRYQASSGEVLGHAVDAFGIDPSRFRFVDYGCGKGRIVMLASAMRFARAVGVEFSPELARVAEANVRRFVAGGGAPHTAEIVLGDAGAFEPPRGPLLAYLYNPFGPAVLREVIERLERKLKAGDEVLVAYVEPRHLQLFEAGGLWEVVEHGDEAALLRGRR